MFLVVSVQEAAAADEEGVEEIQEVSATLVAAAAVKISKMLRYCMYCMLVNTNPPFSIHIKRGAQTQSGNCQHVIC